MGYTKRNKRCIPKEGMPHAQKAWQWKKKREKMHTQRRYATCPQDMSKKREEIYIYIAHVQEKIYKERDRSSNGVHLLSTKNIPHTCTSWSGCMTRFCLDLVFDLTT